MKIEVLELSKILKIVEEEVKDEYFGVAFGKTDKF